MTNEILLRKFQNSELLKLHQQFGKKWRNLSSEDFLNFRSGKIEKLVQQKYGENISSLEQLLAVFEENHIGRVFSIPVDHCPHSFSYFLQTPHGSFLYSGDCLFSAHIQDVVKSADVIVHECTFDDSESQTHVEKKKHSRVKDAINLAKMLNCEKLLLTHFSRKLLNSLDSAERGRFVVDGRHRKYFEECCVLAVDNMWVEWGTWRVLAELKAVMNPATDFVYL